MANYDCSACFGSEIVQPSTVGGPPRRTHNETVKRVRGRFLSRATSTPDSSLRGHRMVMLALISYHLMQATDGAVGGGILCVEQSFPDTVT